MINVLLGNQNEFVADRQMDRLKERCDNTFKSFEAADKRNSLMGQWGSEKGEDRRRNEEGKKVKAETGTGTWSKAQS